MAGRGVGRKTPVWQKSDIAKATAQAERGTLEAVAPPATDPIEVGARAIYEMRSHPKKLRWDQAPSPVRADHVAKMQALMKAIRAEGFVIKAEKRRPSEF